MKKFIVALLLVISFSFTAFALVSSSTFTDQNTFDSWFSSAAKKMKNHGIINGYADGSFRAANQVNRAELAVMLNKFAQVMGKPLFEDGPACPELPSLAFIIFVHDVNGTPVENAQIGLQKWEGLPSDTSFTESQPGMYVGVEDREGYYNVMIHKDGYADHKETIKLEISGCTIFTQTKTVTLAKLPN